MKMVWKWLLALLLAAGAAHGRADEPKNRASGENGASRGARILFVTQSFGYQHGSVKRKRGLSPAEIAITDLGVGSGLFRVDATQDAARDFTKENLQNYDIVMFYTTGPRSAWPVDDATLDYFLNDWLKQPGHGFIGAHSATDTMADYEPYWDMIGGSFNAHPWNSNSVVTVKVHDPEHPLAKPWGKEFQIKDEIYQIKNWQPEKVRVLMSLDYAKSPFGRDVQSKLAEPYHVPIAWCKNYGQGKVFYISLGHNPEVWADPRYMETMLEAVKWILGQQEADATPNPELDAAQREMGAAAVTELRKKQK